MGLFEKLYTLIIISSVLIGLIIGQIDGIEIFADKVILPVLIIMLYLTFIQIPVKDIKQSFSNRKFTLVSIGMNFILTPLLAWMLASTFLADNPALWLGFIMLMVTPCTDWYIIFTGIAKGNVALSTSILPLNLILQLVLLPLYLYLFSGTVGIVNLSIVVESVLFVLILPFVAAYITRSFLLKKKVLEKISSLPLVFLCMAIIAMFASQGKLLLDNLDLLLQLLIPILGFFIINFIIGRIIGRIFNLNKTNTASLNLTTLARNSPIALAIAISAFPQEPLIALVLIIGPLVELPLLSLISYLILKLDKE